MKKIIIFIMTLICAVLMSLFFVSNPVSVSADTGPKKDIEIVIYNLKKSDYIVAYGINYEFWGPHTKFIPGDNEFGNTYYGDVNDLTTIYNNVILPEGWFLCDISSSYKDSTKLVIKSGYMWPNDFILIIYDVVNNEYYLTEETKTYAFHSYFSYDMNNYYSNSIQLNDKIELEKNYNYGKELLEFFIRLLLTLTIEILLALIFKFNKKSFLIILIVNVITQIGLNVGLNLTAFYTGKSVTHIIPYAIIEILIVIVEGIIYRIFCRRGKNETKKWIILYAILANVLSFGLGTLLWLLN